MQAFAFGMTGKPIGCPSVEQQWKCDNRRSSIAFNRKWTDDINIRTRSPRANQFHFYCPVAHSTDQSLSFVSFIRARVDSEGQIIIHAAVRLECNFNISGQASNDDVVAAAAVAVDDDDDDDERWNWKFQRMVETVVGQFLLWKHAAGGNSYISFHF